MCLIINYLIDSLEYKNNKSNITQYFEYQIKIINKNLIKYDEERIHHLYFE
jgi:hypothetical protein